jgi:hypothetical protein
MASCVSKLPIVVFAGLLAIFANCPVTWQLLPVQVSNEFKKNTAKYKTVTLHLPLQSEAITGTITMRLLSVAPVHGLHLFVMEYVPSGRCWKTSEKVSQAVPVLLIR